MPRRRRRTCRRRAEAAAREASRGCTVVERTARAGLASEGAAWLSTPEATARPAAMAMRRGFTRRLQGVRDLTVGGPAAAGSASWTAGHGFGEGLATIRRRFCLAVARQ